MSNRRPEPHAAQQIQRDRLRIIQNSSQQLEDFPTNLEQLSLRPVTSTSDLLQVRSVSNANMLYEPAFNSSNQMVNFSMALNPLAESSWLMTIPHFPSYPSSSSFHSSLQEPCEVRNLGHWMPNYACNSGTNESNPNPNSIFGVEINNELTGPQSQSSPLNNPNGIMQDIIKSASFSEQGSEMTQQTDRGMWVGKGNQLFFVPNYEIQSNQLRLGNPNPCTNRTSDSNNQGLSLSLSSNSQCSLPSRCVSNHASSGGDRVKSLQNTDYRHVGPLGPFTGYATILKNSNFLKPAQELLEEICGQRNEELMKGPDVSGGVGASTSADVANATNESDGVGPKNRSSGASSISVLHCSNGNENIGNDGNRSSSRPSSPPEYQQRMAKFLYMQEEVIRRYRQHQQQMQMVIPSFESVAGLSSATPYISKSLKSISRHFRCLENAISDQVKHIKEVLGEDLSATTSGGASPTGGKHENSNIARLKFLDQSFRKNKFIADGTSHVEHQQHAWRPQQKGLPERAVSVLRAWLFDHFLHPYPTDADKHMLAARTGLTRNQVSNWFINARVRVWKPMVEEIHMLETKGLNIENDTQNAVKSEGAGAVEGGHQSSGDLQPLRSNQLQCAENRVDEEAVEELNAQQWNQEKRSKLGCYVTPSMGGPVMGFVPYRRAEVEVGGAGPVSLTLALKHDDVEAIQQHHQHQLSRHFGGHVINDFVGQ